MMTGKSPLFSSSSTMSAALPSYVALCLILQAHRLASAQFTVTGPDQPITAYIGGESILPCHLSPRMSAENMEVRWFRSQFSSVVHVYRDGQDQYGEQMPEYRQRTELLKDDIDIGRVSLRIHNIQPSDAGQYTCFFQSSVSYQQALLELQVAGLGSAPAISVEGHQDGGIRIVCRSSGWYPEPKVLWRDPQGQLLPSASEKISQEANGLFQTQFAIVLTEESNQRVSCCVRNPQFNQERVSEISIAELFFPRVSPWMVALWVILALLVILIPLAIYCFWRQHRAKDKHQNELRLRDAQTYAVDVTLDPDTAHSNLILSEDRKCVKYRGTSQDLLDGSKRSDDLPDGPKRSDDLPDGPKRFDTYPCMLGAERFTGGKHYWEVEVGNKTRWILGVCRESALRKKIIFTPEGGYWVIRLMDKKYKALTSSSTSLSVSVRPRRVGIFLDYEAVKVSFYNVTDKSHLFTFTDIFFGTLCPFLYTGRNAGGKNEAPLIICPVPAQAEESGQRRETGP